MVAYFPGITSAGALAPGLAAATVRTTLGLGTLATQNGTFSGTSSGTNTGDQDLTPYLPKSGNLSGLANTATSRTNIGLGAADAVTFSTIAATGITAATFYNSTGVTGLQIVSAASWALKHSGTEILGTGNVSELCVRQATKLGWSSSSANVRSSIETYFSRVSSGVCSFGTYGGLGEIQAAIFNGKLCATAITKTALLATTVSATAGIYRVSDVGNKHAYPDTTANAWKYLDGTTVV